MKNQYLLFISILIFIFFGCKNIELQENNISYTNFTKVDSINLKRVKIISLDKNNSYPSSLQDTTICNNWVLTKYDVGEIFSKSIGINSSEWNYYYDHLPCSYSGKLNFDNKSYNFNINGGSWLTVYLNDTVYRYGCKDTICKKYFLSEPLGLSEED